MDSEEDKASARGLLESENSYDPMNDVSVRDTFRLRGNGRNDSDADGDGGVYGRNERLWSAASSGDGGVYDASRYSSVLKGNLIRKEDEQIVAQQDLVE